jgi:predicted kinase
MKIATEEMAVTEFMGSPAGPGGKLIIVCGLPGSGKTTHARRLEQELCAVRFCPDEWITALGAELWESDLRDRIEELQWRLTKDLLALGHTIVIEWGTWGRWERDALREGARALGAAVELHFLDAPLNVLLDRIRLRNVEHPPITPDEITLDYLISCDEQFQRPRAEEMSLFDSTTPWPFVL